MLDDFNRSDSDVNYYNDMIIKTINYITRSSGSLQSIEYVPIIKERDNYNKYPISIKIKNSTYYTNDYTIAIDIVDISKESGWISTSFHQLKRVVDYEELEADSQ